MRAFIFKLTVGVMVTLSLSAALSGCLKESNQKTIERIGVGDYIPDFKTIEGPYGEFNISQFAGKRGVIVLYTISCSQCRVIMPEIEKLWKLAKVENSIENFEMVVINRAENEQDVKRYMTEQGFTMHYHFDPNREVFNLFANQLVPRVYLVNAEGRVTNIWIEDKSVTATEIINKLD